ncbi:hypothetical protein JCM10212_001679 [Sporobolomyces blumeae]
MQHSLYWQDDQSEEAVAARRRREAAIAAGPLRRRRVLEWRGPTHRPSTLPIVDPIDSSSSSETSTRSIHSALLAIDGPAQSSEAWDLELFEPIQTGPNEDWQWGQVWRARASRTRQSDRSERFAVVLKLYDEALFSDPQGETIPEEHTYSRWPPSELEEREATAYSRARELQGRDLPICYGFYTFAIRNGESVTGVVLEDLTDQGHSLDRFVDLMKKRNEISVQLVDRVARSEVVALARFHRCDMT